MDLHALLLRRLPMDSFNDPLHHDAWSRCALTEASDTQLVAAVAAAIAPPKQGAPNSFVLHAPFELLARAALLPRVAPQARAAVRRRIAAIAPRYAGEGPEIVVPAAQFSSVEQASAALLASLRGGDPDGVSAALPNVLDNLPLWQMRAALVDTVVPQLGAAAHTPILLAALPRFADSVQGLGALVHAPLRNVASQPGLQLTWYTNASASEALADPTATLYQRLAHAPSVKVTSFGIAPTMLAVERNGDAARLLSAPASALSPQAAQRVLLRVAALSMLQDTPEHAPYGWTHCLTLPQAVLANANASSNPHMLVAVAATHVLGLRARCGRRALDVNTVLAGEPRSAAHEAAAAVLQAPPAEYPAITTALATHAALHADAHLAKYTLACFDAASDDVAARPIFLAAAAYLAAWWDTHEGRQHKDPQNHTDNSAP